MPQIIKYRIILLSNSYAFIYFLLIILFPNSRNNLIGHSPTTVFCTFSYFWALFWIFYFIFVNKRLRLPYRGFSFFMLLFYTLFTYVLSLILHFSQDVNEFWELTNIPIVFIIYYIKAIIFFVT